MGCTLSLVVKLGLQNAGDLRAISSMGSRVVGNRWPKRHLLRSTRRRKAKQMLLVISTDETMWLGGLPLLGLVLSLVIPATKAQQVSIETGKFVISSIDGSARVSER